MSRRTHTAWWYRSLSAMFAVWFVVATTDLASLHACPMHDGPASGAMPMAGHGMHQGAMQHSSDATLTSDAALTSDASATHGDAPTSEHHSCTCIGSCCAATAPLPTTAAVVAFLATLHEATGSFSTRVIVPRAAWIDFVLPFATAPPMIAHA